MRRRKTALICVLLILMAAALGILGWRIWVTVEKQKLHQAIMDVWNADTPEDMPEYLQYLDRVSRFQIDSIDKGEPWVITVTVKSPDLAAELQKEDPWQYYGEADAEAMDEYMLALARTARLTEQTATIYVWPESDGYRVQFTETFVDAMTGGIYGYTIDLIEEVAGGAA